MSKQNTTPAQGDDVTANHIPCATEPKIVPIGFEVEVSNGVGVWVINSPLLARTWADFEGYDTVRTGGSATGGLKGSTNRTFVRREHGGRRPVTLHT